MWEFETNSVRHYYQKVESAVHYLHGTESQYRYPPLDYVKPEPSTDDTRSSLSMNQDIDLFDLLYVFKSFDSQIPTHMPVNVKTLKQYHNICESRRHYNKFGPTPQATPKSTPQSTPPPTASRIQGPVC
ncbi:hypothetical protein BCR33DRAFT_130102 [Rhizoclosmatium globosum]|uniref:Uncharacterized protein n=1 Tax=Rhizoclosmatium globosum TaxID=329046 RepID=A0A1Y2CHI7_9FUNG|nr:hypothetical protein BCR33DRAFT_130102 [Rhizoclosmatium globosum]|eukprot:ORY46508.1 hypothetical protein BCR33DRAFT_130102 [Rhizoclosmatium globosum]